MAELGRGERTGRARAFLRRRGMDVVPRGGVREGAGRKSLYPGKEVRVTISLTQEAVDLCHALADKLTADEQGDSVVSFSDAVEDAIRARAQQRSVEPPRKK